MNIFVDSLLKEGGHKQSDIARAIGVTRQLISYVIAGKREWLRWKVSSHIFLLNENFEQLEPKYKVLKEEMRNYILQKLKGSNLGLKGT